MKNIILLVIIWVLSGSAYSQAFKTVDMVIGYDFHTVYTSTSGNRINYSGSRTGYRFGGNFNIRIFDKVLFKTGLRYSRIGHQLADFEFNPPNYTIEGEIHFYKQHLDEYYLEIPFLFRYELNQNRFSFFGEFGISPHFALYGKNRTESDLVKTSENFDIQKSLNGRVNLAIVFGFGFNYSLSTTYQLYVMPVYRNYTKGANIPTFIGNNVGGIKNFGVELGVRKIIEFVNNEIK